MEELGSKGTLTLSINPFIAKPCTPFQWLPMADLKQTEKYFKLIKTSLKKYKNIEVQFESTKETYIQGILARGGRLVGEALLQAHLNGGAKAFKRALKQLGLNGDTYLYRERSRTEILPWDSLDMGFTKEYLAHELDMAMQENTPSSASTAANAAAYVNKGGLLCFRYTILPIISGTADFPFSRRTKSFMLYRRVFAV